MAIPSIAVGVAGTDTAWQALAWATDEAASSGSRLVICHGCPAESLLSRHPTGLPMNALELADPPLARAVAAVRTRLGGHRVDVRIRPEVEAVRLLYDAARDADLLVLGAPQRTGWFERRSTTHRLLGQLPCPVVVVRAVPRATRGPFAGHVVVGVDDSAAAGQALEFGFTYAATHRLPLAAVHASTDAIDDLWHDDTTLEAHFSAEPAGLRLLADQVEPWTHKYHDVAVKRAMYTGKALPALLRAAAGARLLVVGTRGRGPAARALLGSVSHGAVDQAAGPVAIAPAHPTGGH